MFHAKCPEQTQIHGHMGTKLLVARGLAARGG